MKEMNWRLSSFLGGGGGRAQGVWVEDGVANAVCDPSVSSSVRLFTSHPGQEPRAPSWAGCPTFIQKRQLVLALSRLNELALSRLLALALSRLLALALSRLLALALSRLNELTLSRLLALALSKLLAPSCLKNGLKMIQIQISDDSKMIIR